MLITLFLKAYSIGHNLLVPPQINRDGMIMAIILVNRGALGN